MELFKNEFGQLIGFPVSDWHGADLPDGNTLTGEYCQLIPMDINNHGDELYKCFCEPFNFSDWTYLPQPAKPFKDKMEFISYLRNISNGVDPYQFSIIDIRSGKAVGSIAMMRIDKDNGVIEIGYVIFSNFLKKTRMATESVYLLIKYAFEDLGYRRVEWKCNNLNEVSKRSALRFGFTFEGVFRQAAVIKGHNRDTAWFSMLDHEFMKIKPNFEAWLSVENFYPDGKQIASLDTKKK
ncbi:GNAT family N-acetyltransferase [Xenorhabdus budapestensis]|uniref:GNAT family N-acetyltransferase n=1 Tax=Xenorhabdus budapestensis TaxID=290110 RepID=UPI003A8C190E